MKERMAASTQASAIAKKHHDENVDIKDYRTDGVWSEDAHTLAQPCSRFTEGEQAKLRIAASSVGMTSGQCDQLIAAVKVRRKGDSIKRGNEKHNAKRNAKTAAMRKERQPKKAKLDEAGLNSSA